MHVLLVCMIKLAVPQIQTGPRSLNCPLKADFHSAKNVARSNTFAHTVNTFQKKAGVKSRWRDIFY